MIRTVFLFVILALPLHACSFCGDGFARRQTLRQQYADAKAVFHGTLKNPKPNADGLGGSTEFHITATLKNDSKLAVPAIFVIPRYIPVIANTPGDVLYFCGVRDGMFDPVLGVPFAAAHTPYLVNGVKLDTANAIGVLGYYFTHLQAADEAVAEDAFLEFARANDANLYAGRTRYDRAKLRAWIADDKVPTERLGVYALLLGLSGNTDDAAWLAERCGKTEDRYRGNLGGLLAGLAILDADRGWKLIRDTLAGDANVSDKLSVLGTLRYFQATRPKESRETILSIYKPLLTQPDLADLAIDDLRRWAWYELTADVLKLYENAKSPLMKRQILRYALSCNDAACAALIAKVRADDPKLLAKVEASMK